MSLSPSRTDLSQAARRVLEAAVQRGRQRGALAAVDILHELWSDDSRAAELLRSTGYDDEALFDDFPADLACEVTTEQVIVEAGRIARAVGRGVEIATEHLLAALGTVAPEIRERLSVRGLEIDSIRAGEHHPGGPPAEPLEADEPVRLSTPAVTEAALQARILDAAANRCREGLRVVEDCLRFAIADPQLTEEAKHVRHGLAAALAALGAEQWIALRDAAGDIGTHIKTASERRRTSLQDVALANCKRVEEALRTLEEFGKLTSPAAAAQIESLRYRFYAIERALLARQSRQQRIARARLYLLLTDRLCPQGLGPVARGAIAGGVDVIQLREKEVADRRRMRLARLVREWTRAAGVLLIINDRPDIAALVDADGVHLGQDDMDVAEARRIVGSRALIGVSTRNLEQAREAVLAGADYLGVGPVFPSETKSFAEFAGLDYVRAASGSIALPWFAIGGITGENLPQALEAGARRIAVSAAVCAAGDPAAATAGLRSALASQPLSEEPSHDVADPF
ncbi:MAG: thiamine phosphate synthase [Planctomyces sp.]|nr:thiamine phosphate synthase [Planctomyces sp.]